MNTKFLEQIASMSPEDLYKAIYCDQMTGVLNRKAFDDNSADHAGAVAVIDLDSLKYLNDTLGHRTGDAFLCGLAEALGTEFTEVYRLSGDEFALLGSNGLEFARKLEQVRQAFPSFSYGIGSTVEEADVKLRADKAFRERCGLRASRGECPPWVAEVEKLVATK